MNRNMNRETLPPASKPLWSAPLSVHSVPETGRHVDLVADEKTRAAVAESIGLRALPRLAARFDVSRRGREDLRVVGRVSATVGQTCVVTLEPIDNEIDEAIDLVFEPPPAQEFPQEDSGGSKVADDDAPEPLVGGIIDLGALAIEFLTLAIDPYPRKSGAAFAAPATGDDPPHPFAALAALKKGRGS